MAQQKTDYYAQMRDKGRINARIIDGKTGLRVLSGVYAVRMHSKHAHVLIMNDYVPTLGKLDGDITFLNQEGEHSYRGVRGFYKHQHNEFTLLIEEYAGKGEEKA